MQKKKDAKEKRRDDGFFFHKSWHDQKQGSQDRHLECRSKIRFLKYNFCNLIVILPNPARLNNMVRIRNKIIPLVYPRLLLKQVLNTSTTLNMLKTPRQLID